MHMDGFRSAFEDSTPPCINLYVADWTLSSVGKYVGGMFGAFFVGLLVECTSFCGSTCTEDEAIHSPGPGWAWWSCTSSSPCLAIWRCLRR